MDTQIKMSPPWISYVRKLEHLFEGDSDIVINYDNEDVSVKLFVSNTDKAEALKKILPVEQVFGNVILKIVVVPPNDTFTSKVQYFRKAFEGNPNVHEIITIDDVPDMEFSNPITYMIFEKQVIQYYDDNLGDAHGNRTTLNEILAREVFGDTGEIFFCTYDEDKNI